MSNGDSFVAAHCRRTAALAMEIGRRAGVDPRAVEQAALTHHAMGVHAIGVQAMGAGTVDGLGRLAWEVVCGDRSRDVTGVVQVCNLLDEQFEALEFGYHDLDEILDEIQSFAAFEGFDPALVDRVRELRCGGLPGDLQLPVQAGAARHVFRALRANPDCDPEVLEEVAMGDPTLTTALLAVANSALYGRPRRVGTVKRAIAVIGVATARKVMLAAAMKPVFASSGLTRLWSHSLSAAPFCASLAEQSGLLNAEDGLVLGLVHDIGAAALQFMPSEGMATYRRLVESGCPETYVERLLVTRDHGELGAELLAEWQFPDHLVEAVRFHHQPERSDSNLAALVYLAEFWSGSEEDLPSFGRLEACLERTGITMEALSEIRHQDAAMRALGSVA